MRNTLVALAAAAMTLAAGAPGIALPLNGGLKAAVDSIDLTHQTAVYVVDGRRYCFYFEGWKGPGWYRCGFAWRRGLGWGGVYGWRSWTYAPAERRYGRSGVTVRGTVRERTRVHEGRRLREGTTTRGTRETTTRGSVTVRGGQNQRPGRGATTGSRPSGGQASPRGGGRQMDAGPRGDRGASGRQQ